MTTLSNEQLRKKIENILLDSAETIDWMRSAELTTENTDWNDVLKLMVRDISDFFASQRQAILKEVR